MNSRKAAADRFADTLGQLQGMRGIAGRLLALTCDPEADLRDVAASVESDAALTARLLRVANASRGGDRDPPGNVREAADRLGRDSLRMFAVTFSLLDRLSNGAAVPIAAGYARRAILMASTASRLARQHRGVSADEAYGAGLLADVGVLIFAQYQPKIYLPACANCLHGPHLVMAERELFDTTHPELGARFLARWGVPVAVVAAVMTHHDDPARRLASAIADGEIELTEAEEEAARPLAAALRAADLFAAALTDGSPLCVRAAAAVLKRDFCVINTRLLAEQVLADLKVATDLFSTPAAPLNAAEALAAFSPNIEAAIAG